MTNVDPDSDHLRWLYQQNLEIAKIFFDWRHKLLSLGLGAASALVVLSAALHSSQPQPGLRASIAAATPALVGMVIAIAVALVNERHAAIIRATYEVGRRLEASLSADVKLTEPLEPERWPFKVLAKPHGDTDVSSRRRYLGVNSFTKVINTLAATIAAICAITVVLTLLG